MHRFPTFAPFLVLCTLLVLGGSAQAQKGPSLDEIHKQIDSADPDTVQAGIEQAGLLGNPKVVPWLVTRIRRGLTPSLLDGALDTLTVLGQPSAGPVLFELLSHRRAEVRRKAVSAVVMCKPSGGESALTTALSDEDAEVRKLAAEGLGTIGARGSVRTLFLALDRGVTESALSIGQLANAEQVQTLMGYLGRAPFDTMSPALLLVLGRADVPTATKLNVVTRLEELATPEVKTFLRTFADAGGAPANQSVRQAAIAAAERIANK